MKNLVYYFRHELFLISFLKFFLPCPSANVQYFFLLLGKFNHTNSCSHRWWLAVGYLWLQGCCNFHEPPESNRCFAFSSGI
jgi:hypothetical protein